MHLHLSPLMSIIYLWIIYKTSMLYKAMKLWHTTGKFWARPIQAYIYGGLRLKSLVPYKLKAPGLPNSHWKPQLVFFLLLSIQCTFFRSTLTCLFLLASLAWSISTGARKGNQYSSTSAFSIQKEGDSKPACMRISLAKLRGCRADHVIASDQARERACVQGILVAGPTVSSI
jgi:hypothetical protein